MSESDAVPVLHKNISIEIDTSGLQCNEYVRNRFSFDILGTSYLRTVAKFDEVVGFSYLRGLHLNDSKEGFDSKRDRHEHIGLCVPPRPGRAVHDVDRLRLN
jgi:hypothetical protein